MIDYPPARYRHCCRHDFLIVPAVLSFSPYISVIDAP